jgi:hypothetical protein
MRAFAVRSFGEPPSVHDLPVPAADGAVLIRVRFAGVNPLDDNLLGRLTAASSYPFVAGIDFAGVAERVPAGDHGLQAGDRVFGMARTHGSYAEYTAAAPGATLEPVARIPDGVTDDQAAALPIPATTALRTVDLLEVTAGQQVVVMGATGGVGGYAVQMARSRGAHVIATVHRRPGRRRADTGRTPPWRPARQGRHPPLKPGHTGPDRPIKDVAAATIQGGEPVWFGCDVGTMMSNEYALWDAGLYDLPLVYDTAFGLDKAERLAYHESAMTHAMLFTGVDLLDGVTRSWRVEREASWWFAANRSSCPLAVRARRMRGRSACGEPGPVPPGVQGHSLGRRGGAPL